MADALNVITINDIISSRQPVDCHIRPDGSLVAYSIADVAHLGKLPQSTAWLATTGEPASPRQITFGPHHDSHPRWSPDGRKLAFLSDRLQRDVCQVFTMDSEIGDARSITDFKDGVTSFRWSPDGTRIACVVPMPDATGSVEEQGSSSDVVVYSTRKLRNALVVVPADGGAPLDGGALASLSLHVLDFDWSPDGASLVVAGTREPRVDEAFRGVQLWRVPLEDGEGLHILTTEGGEDVQPRWSPDGRWIAYRSGAGRTYLALVLSVVPAAGGATRRLTEGFDGSIHGYAWLPDSRGLVAAVQRDMHSSLEQIELETGSVGPIDGFNRRMSVLGRINQSNFSFDRGLTTITSIHEDDYAPRAVWIQRKGEEERQASASQPLGAVRRLAEVQQVSWSGHDGQQISGSVVLPPGALPLGRCPFVVQVHGGPASVYQRSFQAAWNEWGQLLAAQGFVVLRVNPRGSGGRGLDFLTSNYRDWGGGDFDDILRGIDHVVSMGFVDGRRVGIGGWSYGGYLTAWAVTHSDRFRCGVVGAPVINLASFCGTTDIPYGFLPRYYVGADFIQEPDFYREGSPLYAIDALNTPTLLLHGEADVRVPLGQSIEWYTAARERGQRVELVTYPREDHAIKEPEHQRDVLERVIAWFTQYLLTDIRNT